jgi:hypothetical protein
MSSWSIRFAIMAGEVLEDWSDAKREQNDVDARWTERHGK